MSVTSELMTERQVELADIDNKNDKCVSHKQRRCGTNSTGAAYSTT